ncbi:hypothetical protein STEG23_003806 [Scotinomys teguina]
MAEWMTLGCDYKAGEKHPKGQKPKHQDDHNKPTEDTEQEDDKMTPRSLSSQEQQQQNDNTLDANQKYREKSHNSHCRLPDETKGNHSCGNQIRTKACGAPIHARL